MKGLGCVFLIYFFVLYLKKKELLNNLWCFHFRKPIESDMDKTLFIIFNL